VRILEYVAYDVVLQWRGLNYPRYCPNFLDYLGVNWLYVKLLQVSKTFHYILTQVVRVEGKSLREHLWDMQRDKMLAVMKAGAYSDKDADAVRVMLSSIIKSPHVFELAEFMFWRQRYLFPDRYDRAERTRELAKRRLNEF
jgi:hypothetical protein